MSATLPPYSGDVSCPKCGYNLVGTKYRASNYGTSFAGVDIPRWLGYPLDMQSLERDCKRCEFAWLEAPLSPEDEGKQIARVAFDKAAS